MCERLPSEKWLPFVLRWLCSNPQWLVAAVFVTAASLIYIDFRAYIHEQSQLQRDTVRVLTELTLRVENLETTLKK